jgi:hypothetical protein
MKRAKDRNGNIILKINTEHSINNIDKLEENITYYIDALPLIGKKTCFRADKEHIISCRKDALSYSNIEIVQACESMENAISSVDIDTIKNNKVELSNLSSDVILLYVCKHILYGESIPCVQYDEMSITSKH